jgi:hypothetical protein
LHFGEFAPGKSKRAFQLDIEEIEAEFAFGGQRGDGDYFGEFRGIVADLAESFVACGFELRAAAVDESDGAAFDGRTGEQGTEKTAHR